MLEKIKQYKSYLLTGIFGFLVMMPQVFAAGEVSVDTATMTSIFTQVASSITDVIGDVAPIAIGVTAVFLVWKYGVKFFKGLLG